jgi:hypothetical protein
MLYLEELISMHTQSDENDSKMMKGKLDLQNILKVNQLKVEFDTSLEKTTEEVYDFWSCLMYQKDTDKLFTKGIAISKSITKVQALIEDISTS